MPEGAGTPAWSDISTWPQRAYGIGSPGRRQNISQWGAPQSAVVRHFLRWLLVDSGLSDDQKLSASTKLMEDVWHALRNHADDPILSRGTANGTFRLDPRWLRTKFARPDEVWECDTCATLSTHNIRGVCPRNRCPGTLLRANQERLGENHYLILYQSADFPPVLSAEEHTVRTPEQ